VILRNRFFSPLKFEVLCDGRGTGEYDLALSRLCRLDSGKGGKISAKSDFLGTPGVGTAFVFRELKIVLITYNQWLFITRRQLQKEQSKCSFRPTPPFPVDLGETYRNSYLFDHFIVVENPYCKSPNSICRGRGKKIGGDMMKRRLIVLISVILVGMGAFGTSSVAKDVTMITKDELKAMLGNLEVVIIDARYDKHWMASDMKIKGAVREDYNDVKSWADKYNKNRLIVVYCA